jgi:hypothetical protein
MLIYHQHRIIRIFTISRSLRTYSPYFPTTYPGGEAHLALAIHFSKIVSTVAFAALLLTPIAATMTATELAIALTNVEDKAKELNTQAESRNKINFAVATIVQGPHSESMPLMY